MRPRIIISLFGLLLLAAAPVWAAGLAPSTEELVKALGNNGYKYQGMSSNKATFTRKDSKVQVSLNDKGLVYSGGISIGPKADTEATILALYTLYATLEVNKGRTRILDEKVALTKMKKLIDSVESALKVSARTQFRFENMEVLATRNDETDFITIGLKPH
jgi:hypothetical protein